MPYYNDPSSDIQQGMQGSFNPMTGRLNTGNMVLEFLARMAGQKEQKKKEQWETEDRASELEMRNLQKTQAEQGIAMNQRKIQDYQKPVSPAAQFVMDRLGAVAEEQRRMREIEAQGKQTRQTNSLKPTKTAKELDSDYLADVADVEKQYAGMEVSARSELQKALTALVSNRFLSPETYESDVKAAKDQYKETVDTIAAKKEATLKAIDERYADIPRAKLSSAKRGKATPAPAPTPTATETYPVGTQRRNKKTGEVQEWDGTKWVTVKK